MARAAVGADVSKSLWIARGALAGLWGYEGLWLKVIARDAHEKAIVAHALGPFHVAPGMAMLAIGLCETALAAAILSGVQSYRLAWFQLVVLLLMHGTATLSGSLADPADLWAHSLPTYACVLFLILNGRRK